MVELKIKDSFWIVSSKNEKRTTKVLFDNESEAISFLKTNIKSNIESILQMFIFKGEDVELKQVGWEQIAKQVIKNEN